MRTSFRKFMKICICFAIIRFYLVFKYFSLYIGSLSNLSIPISYPTIHFQQLFIFNQTRHIFSFIKIINISTNVWKHYIGLTFSSTLYPIKYLKPFLQYEILSNIHIFLMSTLFVSIGYQGLSNVLFFTTISSKFKIALLIFYTIQKKFLIHFFYIFFKLPQTFIFSQFLFIFF